MIFMTFQIVVFILFALKKNNKFSYILLSNSSVL